MTGDPLALGLVIALGSIPRGVFNLIGGAITDRVSPRQGMLLSDIIRLFLTALMAGQIFTGTLQGWMIYTYSLMFGIVGGGKLAAVLKDPDGNLIGLDETIPVLKYQILPTFGASTIAPDIAMKEMSISYQPGLVIKEDFGGWGEHGSTVDSKLV